MYCTVSYVEQIRYSYEEKTNSNRSIKQSRANIILEEQTDQQQVQDRKQEHAQEQA